MYNNEIFGTTYLPIHPNYHDEELFHIVQTAFIKARSGITAMVKI